MLLPLGMEVCLYQSFTYAIKCMLPTDLDLHWHADLTQDLWCAAETGKARTQCHSKAVSPGAGMQRVVRS